MTDKIDIEIKEKTITLTSELDVGRRYKTTWHNKWGHSHTTVAKMSLTVRPQNNIQMVDIRLWGPRGGQAGTYHNLPFKELYALVKAIEENDELLKAILRD
jgi:hypothetical protein